MRTGIFGGTFNPVHNGHLKLAYTYLDALALDRMLVIPTRIPPHKKADHLVSGEDRLEMCRRAFESDRRFWVSDIELCREGKSYTVNTLEELHSRFPDDEFYLIMGSDMFFTLTEWFHWQRLFELAVMCVGEREPDLNVRLREYAGRLEKLGARCRVVDLKPVEVSSTQVRQCIADGKDISGLVPPGVAGYILEKRLYGSKNPQ